MQHPEELRGHVLDGVVGHELDDAQDAGDLGAHDGLVEEDDAEQVGLAVAVVLHLEDAVRPVDDHGDAHYHHERPDQWQGALRLLLLLLPLLLPLLLRVDMMMLMMMLLLLHDCGGHGHPLGKPRHTHN